MPHIAGMQVNYDPSDLTSFQVFVGNEPLKPERKYIVASTDMEFADYINYLVLPDEKVEYEVPTIMPEVLEDYIAAHSPVHAPNDKRFIEYKDD